MRTGDVILLPFPFAERTNVKVRPGVVICLTKDKYQEVVVSAISSVVPLSPGQNEILVQPDQNNKLRAKSVIKVDRIVTVKAADVITTLGKLSNPYLSEFKFHFKKLVD